jgi:hypothetical protein
MRAPRHQRYEMGLTVSIVFIFVDAGWAAVIGAKYRSCRQPRDDPHGTGEPRVLKELKTLNEVILASPEQSAARCI